MKIIHTTTVTFTKDEWDLVQKLRDADITLMSIVRRGLREMTQDYLEDEKST